MHLSLSKAVPFVYLASVCRSLQCLISSLTQWAEMVSCLGLLVQSCCGEGGALQTNITGVWGALAVFRPHWVCPHSRRMCFPRLHGLGSRLLYRERALSCVYFPGPGCSNSGFRVLHKGPDSVGPAFYAFPGRSSSGNQELDKSTLSGCSGPYCLRGPSLSFQACWSGVPCVSFGDLISGCDPPGGCQPSAFQEVFG